MGLYIVLCSSQTSWHSRMFFFGAYSSRRVAAPTAMRLLYVGVGAALCLLLAFPRCAVNALRRHGIAQGGAFLLPRRHTSHYYETPYGSSLDKGSAAAAQDQGVLVSDAAATAATSTPFSSENSSVKNSKMSKAMAINRFILDTFNSNDVTDSSLNKLKIYLNDNIDHINQINVITLLHRLAKFKSRAKNLRNRATKSAGKTDLHDVFSLFKNRNETDSSSTEAIFQLLSVGNAVASSQGVANALYSLQIYDGPGSASRQVLRLVATLTEQLGACAEYFEGQAVANMLYGLKSFTADSREVFIDRRASLAFLFCLPACLSTYLSIYLPTYPSIHLSLCHLYLL